MESKNLTIEPRSGSKENMETEKFIEKLRKEISEKK